MITVSISFNGNILYARSARRQEAIKSHKPNTYKTDAGEIIEHNYDEGVIPLAKKILDTIKEDY
jgi:hypothetical protein